jgi:hypothetical protein
MRIDRHSEGRTERRCIVAGQHRDFEFIQPFASHRNANEPAPVFGHKVDGFRRHLLGCDDQIAFIFPVLVVHDDDEVAFPQFLKCFFNGCQRHVRSPRL